MASRCNSVWMSSSVGWPPTKMPDFDANEGLARLPGAAPGGRPAPAFIYAAVGRYLDVLLVVLATPAALILGAPALGCAIGAVAWLGQRLLAQLDRRLIEGRTELQTRLGLNLVEAFGRIWLLAGAIVIAAVAGGRADGLAASVMIFSAYSIAFAMRLVKGRPGGLRA
jgi:hypothetical protein